MTIPKNIERNNILLTLWQQGFTVEHASLVSGIPGGTVSYYYSRFNSDSQKYKEIILKNVEDQSDSFISRWSKAKVDWLFIVDILEKLIGEGDYAKANEFLKFTKSFDEIQAKHLQKRKNLQFEFSSLREKGRIDKLRKKDQKKYGTKIISKSDGSHIPAYELHPLPKDKEIENEEIEKISLKLIFDKSIANLHK